MPLPEYIPSDLPQYAYSVDRTSFNSAVVQSGDVLMFIESGKLIVKKDDGNFYEIGEGSGGTDVSDTTATPADVLVTAAFYDSTGTKQSGTIPTVSAGISGSAVVVPSGYIAAEQTFPVSGGVDVSSTTAEAGGVLSGLIFYDSTGNQTTGTIPTVSAAVSGSNVVVPVGYIGTSQTFPVTGGGIDLSSTTAVSGGVLSGLIFYDSAGNKTTGTIPMVTAAMSGSTLVIQSGYLGVSVAIPIFMDVSSTTITSDMVLSGGIFYDSAGVQRSGTIPTVSAIRSDSEIIVPRGYISSPQQFNVSGGVDVSDTTAEDYMVMSGALFYDSDGNLTTGTIPYVSAPEDMITPTTSYQTISGGGYLDMDIVIEGDPYLVPQNIKAGVWIFGVEGTYGDFSEVTAGATEVLEGFTFLDAEGSLRSGTIPYAVVPDYWITPTTTSQQIGSGYLEDNVIIAGDSNLVASNIRSGVVIFDVEGEYEGSGEFDFSDVTADPEDVLEDEVFYDSNGDLQFGTMRAEYDIEPIMPSTSSQVVSGDCYLGADLVISGDSNLVASNIRSGVTIFGVTGSYSATGESVVPGYIVNSNGSVTFQPIAAGAAAEVVSTLKVVSTGQPEPAYSGASVDVVAGYYVNNSGTLTFQPLASGASAEAVSSMHIVNTGVSEPEYASGGGGATMNFYKCASVTAATSETFYLISGAGESGCNGTWSATTSSSYDKPIYQNEYGATMVYQGYDTWEIDAPSGDIAWYIGVGSTDPSQITNWTGAGMSPAPSITESSVSTAATWAGYLAMLYNGIYKYASTATSGLTYSTGYIPEVGKTYTADAMIEVNLWSVPTNNLVFYAPLSSASNTAETGQDLVEEGNVTFQTVDGIPCAYSDTTCGIRTNTQATTIDTGVPKSISVWVNIIQFNQNEDYQGTFCSMQWGGGSTFYYVKDSASSGHLVFARWSTGGEGSYIDLQLGTFNLNTWYHFAVVDTGTEMKGFVNGTLIQTANVSSYYQKTGNSWYFGPNYLGQNVSGVMDGNIIGYMAAPRIYSRALSENEVLALSKEFTPTAS